MALLAELTHRCQLQCPYCSNPLELERVAGEMRTDEWLRAIREAAELGCMQVHFSGGEPTVRRDLEELVAGATEAGLYTNLITSGVLLEDTRRNWQSPLRSVRPACR
jgi:pyrroloquinoline quinone biosynthesis protein E